MDPVFNKHTGGLVLASDYGKYYEAVSKGRVFGGATAAAGVAPGTAVGTTAAFALHNPLGSGVNLSVLQGSVGYVSGTLGAGLITWNANVDPQLALPTGTAITIRNMLLAGTRGDGQGLAFTTATIAAPTIIRPAFMLDASLATTAGIGLGPLVDYVDGVIVVAPGGTVSLHGTAAAGSTPLVIFGCIWIEIPIL